MQERWLFEYRKGNKVAGVVQQGELLSIDFIGTCVVKIVSTLMEARCHSIAFIPYHFGTACPINISSSLSQDLLFDVLSRRCRAGFGFAASKNNVIASFQLLYCADVERRTAVQRRYKRIDITDTNEKLQTIRTYKAPFAESRKSIE